MSRLSPHVLLAAAVMIAMPVVAAEPQFPPGPYKVGFSQRVETRPGETRANISAAVLVTIYYPVDPADVDVSTPRPVYRVNPLASARPIPSSAWDVYGVEPTYLEVPIAAGPFPLVVFSHGWGSNWTMSLALGPRVASYGYVFVAVGHQNDRHPSVAAAAAVRDPDLRFVLDRVLERNATSGDLLEGAIDPERIAFSGSSLGGYGAMALTAGDGDVCDLMGPPDFEPPPEWSCIRIEPDPRIQALVLLDASNQLLTFAELQRVTVPVIGIGRDFDSIAAQDGLDFAPWQARQHAAFSSTPKYRVDIAHTIHSSFGLACENQVLLWKAGYITEAQMIAARQAIGCLNPGVLSPGDFIHPIVVRYAVAFLETHLAGRPGLHWMLTPGHALAIGTRWQGPGSRTSTKASSAVPARVCVRPPPAPDSPDS